MNILLQGQYYLNFITCYEGTPFVTFNDYLRPFHPIYWICVILTFILAIIVIRIFFPRSQSLSDSLFTALSLYRF